MILLIYSILNDIKYNKGANMEKTRIAICYDFDKTLSRKDMQCYGFAKHIDENIDDFWQECSRFSEQHNADNIMSYMYMMLRKCEQKGILPTRKFFNDCGKDIDFFDGVAEWFENINKFAESKNVILEHYIISSGVKEIIEGTSIAKYFKAIFACSYCYDKDGNAFWPALNINYTSKTQYLYRINKGLLNCIDDSVNDYMSYDDRRIPFENIIYIGDSQTDIPSMKLLRAKHGSSIGVYDADDLPDYYKTLINQSRVDYIARANYTIDSELSHIIREIIETIYHKDVLRKINLEQRTKAKR